jgi:hypothetical protein
MMIRQVLDREKKKVQVQVQVDRQVDTLAAAYHLAIASLRCTGFQEDSDEGRSPTVFLWLHRPTTRPGSSPSRPETPRARLYPRLAKRPL